MNSNRILKISIWMVFFILLLRLFQIQILRHEHFLELSLKNYLKALKLHAPRGGIYDRRGKLLACWEPEFRISIIPELLPEENFEELKSILGTLDVNPETLRVKSNYVTIKTKIPIDKVLKIEENYEKFPSVFIDAEPSRVYSPGYSFLSHIIGYVGEVSRREIEKYNLSPGDIIGKAGIEATYDSVLRGKDGYRFIAIDSRGFIVDLNPRPPIPPEKGRDIHLSVDAELMAFIDSIFRSYKKGAVVVYNPQNGEILALYSKPYYNPALIKKKWKEYVEDPSTPLVNRAIQGLYPPGSVFKVISALIGLESGKISANTTFFCGGSYKFGNRVWKCWNPGGHGELDLVHAIEQSCDVYFYQLGLTVGLRNFLRILHNFGLPSRTGIDLLGEYSVLLPTEEYYMKKYGKYGVTEGYVMNLAIGQGEILLTPLWMAFVTGLIGNEGSAALPHLVMGKEPEVFKLNLPQQYFKIVKKGMLEVVEGDKGTAHLLAMPDIVFAGKTGTAQNPHGKDHSLFTCFSPFDKPEIVITVIVENAGHGSEAAAPIAAKILRWWYEKR